MSSLLTVLLLDWRGVVASLVVGRGFPTANLFHTLSHQHHDDDIVRDASAIGMLESLRASRWPLASAAVAAVVVVAFRLPHIQEPPQRLQHHNHGLIEIRAGG